MQAPTNNTEAPASTASPTSRFQLVDARANRGLGYREPKGSAGGDAFGAAPGVTFERQLDELVDQVGVGQA